MGNTGIHRHKGVRSPPCRGRETRERDFEEPAGCRGAGRMRGTSPFRTRKKAARSRTRRSIESATQASLDVGAERSEICCCGRRKGTDDDIRALGNQLEELRAHCLQSAANGVPNHCGSYLLADDEPESGWPIIRATKHRSDQARTAASSAATDCLSVVDATGQTIWPGEHWAYAESSTRPFPRRAERMARPARVRIRARKPCFLARRRLLGWKVRLLMESLRNWCRRGFSSGDRGYCR